MPLVPIQVFFYLVWLVQPVWTVRDMGWQLDVISRKDMSIWQSFASELASAGNCSRAVSRSMYKSRFCGGQKPVESVDFFLVSAVQYPEAD